MQQKKISYTRNSALRRKSAFLAYNSRGEQYYIQHNCLMVLS